MSGVFSTVVKCKNFSSSGGAMVAVKVILLLHFIFWLFNGIWCDGMRWEGMEWNGRGDDGMGGDGIL